jgi:hypothetical protein
MSLCPYCGHSMLGSDQMCGYHSSPTDGEDWATGNRIMCDFVHRGIVPLRPRATSGVSLDVLFDDSLDTALVA